MTRCLDGIRGGRMLCDRMKLRTIVTALALGACGGDGEGTRAAPGADAGAGGSQAAGGASAAGGSAAGGAASGGAQSGGAPSAGGSAAGGTAGAGGSISSGGASGSGGTPEGDSGASDAATEGAAPEADGGPEAATEAGPGCECTEGACCDGCSFRPFGTLCAERVYESECSSNLSQACPARAERVREQWERVFCSGSSEACDGHRIHLQTVLALCPSGSYCREDGESPIVGVCGPC